MRLVVPLALVSTVVAGALALGGTASGQVPVRSADSATHTTRVVVRPVTGHGHAAPGWTVTREPGSRVDCEGSSPAAVDPNIWTCFPTVEYAVSCWKSHHHTVLCLRDARVKKLVRLRWTGTLSPVTPPARPTPQDMLVGNAQPCQIRDGGAWAQLPTHPRWNGDFSCTHGDVYGPSSGDGINRSHQPWTVHLWKNGTAHHVVVRQVRTAYFVGTRG